MKVLHVVNVSFVIPYYLGDQLNYFSDRGFEVFIACSPSPHLYECAQVMPFKPIPVQVLRTIDVKQDLLSIKTLVAEIKKHKIDIVIGHTPKGAMIAMIAASIAGVKKRVYFKHGLMYETSTGIKKSILKSIERLTSSLATQVVCVSKSVMEKSNAEHLGKPVKNILLNKGTCNGIDLKRFTTRNCANESIACLKNKYRITEADIIIGYVGRLVNDKGISELIGAWKHLLPSIKNIKLLLVGPFEARDSISDTLKKYITEEPSIIHTGLVSDVASFYCLMDIFVLPSYREGFPTVVLEASAMELPVVTTKATGCIDSIIDKETGLYVSLDPNDIAAKIQLLIENKDLRAKLGRNGADWVANNFKQEVVWEEIETKVLN